jgi:hypothetical protein
MSGRTLRHTLIVLKHITTLLQDSQKWKFLQFLKPSLCEVPYLVFISIMKRLILELFRIRFYPRVTATILSLIASNTKQESFLYSHTHNSSELTDLLH